MEAIYDLRHILAYSEIAYNYADDEPSFNIRMKNEMDKKKMTCRELAKRVERKEQTIKDFRSGSKQVGTKLKIEIAKALRGDDYYKLLIDQTRTKRGLNKLYQDIENDRLKPGMKKKLEKALEEYDKEPKESSRSDSCLPMLHKLENNNFDDFNYFNICFAIYCRFDVKLMRFIKELKSLPEKLQEIVKDEIISTVLPVEIMIKASYKYLEIIEEIKEVKDIRKKNESQGFVFKRSSEIYKLRDEISNKFGILEFIHCEECLQLDTGFHKPPKLQIFYDNKYCEMNEKEKQKFGSMCYEKLKDLIEYHETLLQIIPEDWDMIVALILLGINQDTLPKNINTQLEKLLKYTME